MPVNNNSIKMPVNMDDVYNDDNYYLTKTPRVKNVRGCISKSGRTVRYSFVIVTNKNILGKDIETTKLKHTDFSKNHRNHVYCSICASRMCFDPFIVKNMKDKKYKFVTDNIKITSETDDNC